MSTVISIFQVVSAVAKIFVAIKGASDAKKDAKNQRDIDNRRLKIEAQQREAENAKETARLRRVARQKRASLTNTAATNNVIFSSGFTGASTAVKSNEERETNFVDLINRLGRQSDDVTRAQIDLNFNKATSKADADLFSGVFEGLGSLAGVADDSGIFGGDDDPVEVGDVGTI